MQSCKGRDVWANEKSQLGLWVGGVWFLLGWNWVGRGQTQKVQLLRPGANIPAERQPETEQCSCQLSSHRNCICPTMQPTCKEILLRVDAALGHHVFCSEPN